MDNKQYKTVVQGEASESDSEEEELTNVIYAIGSLCT